MEPNKNTSVFLKDVANIVMGQSPAGSSYNPNEGIEFHQGKSYFGEVLLDRSPIKTTQPTKFAQDGDIVICVRAPVGIVNITDRKICIGRGLASISAKDSIDQRFLFYLIQSKKKVIEILASGSTFSCISGPQLSELMLDIPSKDKQSVISKALYSLEKHISNLEQLICKQESIKKTTVNLLLTPKPDWTEYKIKEKFKVTRGLVLSTNQMSKSQNGVFQYPVYSSQTQNNGLIGFYNNFLYQDAITWTTDGANAGFVRFRPGKFYCTNVCGVLLSDEGYANTCVATMLGNVSKKYVSYVGNPKLMNNVMAEIPLLFPSVQEQQYISDKIQKLDQQLEHLQSELDKYRNIKKGLMDYFFG